MHHPKPPIGFSHFPEVIRKGYYYVDKSLLVRAVLDSPARVLLLPRPRRFGKTLNLSLLRTFFERGRPEHAGLFQGLAITRAGEEYMAHQGRYPVVFLTLKDVKEENWESCLAKLKYEIAAEFKRHRADLLETDVLSASEKEDYESILSRKAEQVDYESSFKDLLTWLERAHGEQVVLLIDEYDTPIHAGYQYGYYQAAVRFMRNWLGGALKDHESLERGVLTGILRIAKESIFSGFNNLRVEDILEPGPFADKFGFTEAEVEKLLADCGLTDSLPDVREWYNGYRFGETTLYNPWSLVNFINDRTGGQRDGPPRPHWINTSENSLVFELIRDSGPAVGKGMEQLLRGGVVCSEIEDTLSLRDVGSREKSVWSLLLFSGYLKAVGQERWGEAILYQLQLPNREIRGFFLGVVNRVLEAHLEGSALRALFRALMAGNVTAFEEHLQTLVMNLLSFHDTGAGQGRKPEKRKPEAVYQSFVLGLLANLGEHYRIRSNIESGLGRADILMVPKTDGKGTGGKRGIVMEFKRLRKGEKMERQLNLALKQIQDKNYGSEMRAAGGPDILALAIVFDGKRLRVRAGADK
uniref:PD-(D/E)XK nuclease superfamily protein n=1 Tax=Candidatus Kentrum sp. FM TaxID=2126340 RepID=A0A450TU66_9GAMM|nr:MAG: PD-(D/E)XK nuclease superfamily protein [Candidatus Kentron sp. FM]VFJ73843.1 MAG: PD-(D/E)XK nuclease superfamily protein [Candidatus Kentron sp. FM]VFK20756.1 MAG: PD-(D/E)XK nuclease superfamily protein [Candidatus Kentron sp. FM]